MIKKFSERDIKPHYIYKVTNTMGNEFNLLATGLNEVNDLIENYIHWGSNSIEKIEVVAKINAMEIDTDPLFPSF